MLLCGAPGLLAATTTETRTSVGSSPHQLTRSFRVKFTMHCALAGDFNLIKHTEMLDHKRSSPTVHLRRLILQIGQTGWSRGIVKT